MIDEINRMDIRIATTHIFENGCGSPHGNRCHIGMFSVRH